ncbi:hypothetical protein F5B20DRAFT_582834 [Whalleya microplaca]|nr:hypothetical protein F5B20DRAFT_582834 [Whalleya microplaca]
MAISPADLLAIDSSFEKSSFLDVCDSEEAKDLVAYFVQNIVSEAPDKRTYDETRAVRLGLASLGAFLQANVTGPVLEGRGKAEAIFLSALKGREILQNGVGLAKTDASMASFRRLCIRSLDTDGVSVYPYIPHIELFCLSRFIFTSGSVLPAEMPEIWSNPRESLSSHLAWTRLRIHLWHYRLITQPSLGPGSLFTKSGRWTDVPTLQELIEKSLLEAETSVVGTAETDENQGQPMWPQESRIQFRLEEANCHILLGNDRKARKALQSAAKVSGFVYALSGALGKRTRFQEKNISQLVVLAKSLQVSPTAANGQAVSESAPAALPLNDDTLLENIKFNSDQRPDEASALPIQLQDITPENQPSLRPVDQILLLTEATLKDTFSPTDSLTSEEILPFAVRVIQDESTNWQVYTQALLVRSRIELNRSRTIERGVLQMQALVDQVIVDTQEVVTSGRKPTANGEAETTVPGIKVTTDGEPDHSTDIKRPTSFLPAPKPSESASAHDRLRYVDALASPPRWHLESELAYAWTAVGSLVSALEIFKRLRLWPEVALCLSTTAASDDPDGRGGGGDEKARAIVRWRLFHRTGTAAETNDDDELENPGIDLSSLKASDFSGPERSPPPPNAPRLFCILGDLENDAQHYRRAWEISNRRFARAQRSLGELHLRRQEWTQARDAYALAVGVNRLNSEMWGRLGDIELRLARFPDAAAAFQRAIATSAGTSTGTGIEADSAAGEDARTWSNLGTALLSWYREVVAESKDRLTKLKSGEADPLGDAEAEEGKEEGQGASMESTRRAAELGKSAQRLLQDALQAFKRGAQLANSNWRIWDNVVTLAAALSPEPDLEDVVLGLRNVLRIRKSEDALDLDVLTLLVREATKTPAPVPNSGGSGNGSEGDGGTVGAGVYDPPRGTIENKIVALFETDIGPLITTASTAWSLISRLRAWRRDWAGALDAAEKGWRTAVGTASSSAALSTTSSEASWLTDPAEFDLVVQRTEELVAAYENYGVRVPAVGERWKGKARSAVRSVLGKARVSWEGDRRWEMLKRSLEELR